MLEADAMPILRGCPKCGTRFRFAPDLLQVAGGQVRCGACLTVFDGRVEEAQPLAPEPQPPAPEPQPPAAQEPAETVPLPQPTASVPGQPEAPLEPIPKPTASVPGTPGAPLEPLSKPTAPVPGIAEGPLEPAEHWHAAPRPLADAPPPEQEPPPDAARPEQTPDAEAPAPVSPPIRLGARAGLRPKAKKPKRPRRTEDDGGKRRTALLGLVVFLAFSLTVSIFGMRFEDWSRLAHLRPLYEGACGVIGCRVRTPKDLSAWTFTTNSVARLGYPEPIVVTADLANNAAYGQRFPTLLARFTTADGEVLGEERLRPRDYLPERPSRRLAPNQSATVVLRFKDPGHKATHHAILLL